MRSVAIDAYLALALLIAGTEDPPDEILEHLDRLRFELTRDECTVASLALDKRLGVVHT
jgi:hypothetical protein